MDRSKNRHARELVVAGIPSRFSSEHRRWLPDTTKNEPEGAIMATLTQMLLAFPNHPCHQASKLRAMG